MTTMPFQDATLTPEQRAGDLLARLTVEEKAGQLTQYFYMTGGDPSEVVDNPESSSEAGAAQTGAVEAELARGRVGSLLFLREANQINRLQKLAIEGNRWGIPLIFGFDVIHGLRTVAPVPIALAASWSPETIEDAWAVAASEARATGIHWAFAPMVDLARDPRWGRIIEGAGEDPVLGAAVAAAQVRGFQGERTAEGRLDADRIIAGPKHFAGYGAAVGGRDYEDSDISDSELHNIYLPPFKGAVDAGAGNIMSAYMDLNGVPASGNAWLLTDVLRDEFGFDGWVVSDANAVRSLVTQHFARDLADAGARAVNAGLDMEMAMEDAAFAHLPEAVASGAVSEEALDTAVRRVLEVKFRLGLFENPYVDADRAAEVVGRPEHRDRVRVAAERTAVLLKNDMSGLRQAQPAGSVGLRQAQPAGSMGLRQGQPAGRAVLPLEASGKIAVIGQLADSKRDVLGPWIFDFDLDETVTILDGIRARAEGAEVGYAPGPREGERVYKSMFDAMDHGLPAVPEGFDDDAEFARAVELAGASDVAVVVIGQSQNMIGEKASTSTLDLPGRQLELLQAVHATGTPVVAVVLSGRPVDLRWADAHVPAMLQVWYPGTRAGEAVARLLFGDVSPAGRLPFTWPRTVGQVPMYYNHYRTFAPQEADKRYWDEESTPLYVFGHGLTYSTIEYSNVAVEPARVAVGQKVTVSATVTNSGAHDTDEVVQLYIHQRYGSASRPVRELKGFERVSLAAGESRTVMFELGPDQLRYWNAAARDWVQDATTIDVYVGGSSAAEASAVLEVAPAD